MNVIGKVRLARGEVAFYDDLSRIHLTLSRPVANVLSTMNTAALRRAVQYKRLELIAGTLLPVNSASEGESFVKIEDTTTVNTEITAEAATGDRADIEETVIEEAVEEKKSKKKTGGKPKKTT